MLDGVLHTPCNFFWSASLMINWWSITEMAGMTDNWNDGAMVRTNYHKINFQMNFFSRECMLSVKYVKVKYTSFPSVFVNQWQNGNISLSQLLLCSLKKIFIIFFYSFMYNIEKLPNMLWKSCSVHSARIWSKFDHFSILCLRKVGHYKVV